MRYPSSWHPLEEKIKEHFPALRPAQQRGLVFWVMGTILARSGCQNAVMTALLALGRVHAVRQYLREWLYEGEAKAAPCSASVDVSLCFAPLFRWVMSMWQSDRVALAIDATLAKDRVAALVISVLYNGSAIPVAWQMMPANKKGKWIEPVIRLIASLEGVAPEEIEVLVLSDRGLWSPRLWSKLKSAGWHPLMRVKVNTTFQPEGGTRLPARMLVPGPGHACVARGAAFKAHKRSGTIIVVWAEGQEAPWIVLTDLEPDRVGIAWYGMRWWIEVGFRAMKSVGWRWEHTRRSDPERVSRHWLVLAVATLWVLASGTRAEEAQQHHVLPGRMAKPRAPAWGSRPRLVSLFTLGLSWTHAQLMTGRLWRSVWLSPQPWPNPPPDMAIRYHPPLSQPTAPT